MEVDDILREVTETKIQLVVLALALSNIADAAEVVSIGYVISNLSANSSSMSDMSLNQGDKELLGASVIIGLVFGGLFFGYLSDMIGRKPSLQLALGFTCISGLLATLSPSVNFLICMRMSGGFGVGGVLPVIFTYGAELFPSCRRDSLIATIGLYWVIGSLYASVMAWLLFESTLFPLSTWRLYVFVCALPSLLALGASQVLLVESPNFLIDKKRPQEALRSLSYLCERELTTECVLGLHPQQIDVGQTLHMIFHPPNLLPFLILSVIWFAQHFSSFGMMTWISSLFIDVGLQNPYFDSIIFALAILPGNLFAVNYITSVGRRPMLFWGMILSASSILGFAFAPTNTLIVVISASLYNLFLVVAWSGLCCLSADGYFNMQVKSFAMGLLSASGRIGGLVAQFVYGYLEKDVFLLISITSLIIFLGASSVYLLPKEQDYIIISDGDASPGSEKHRHERETVARNSELLFS